MNSEHFVGKNFLREKISKLSWDLWAVHTDLDQIGGAGILLVENMKRRCSQFFKKIIL